MYKTYQRTALLIVVLATLAAVGLSLFGIGQVAVAEGRLPAEDRRDTAAGTEQPADAAELPQPETTDAQDPAEQAGTFPGRQWGNPGQEPAPDTEDAPVPAGSSATEPAEAEDSSATADFPEPAPEETEEMEETEETEPEETEPAPEETEEADTEAPAPSTETPEETAAPVSAETIAEPIPSEEEPEGFVYYAGIYRADYRAYLPVDFSRELQEYTWEMCKKYDVSYEIMLGLFGVESGWKSDLYNYNGTCFGLGMLNIQYSLPFFSPMGIDVMTPKGNIEASCQVLATKLKEFDGNLIYALMAYNAGTGGARSMIANGVRSNYYSDSIICFSENLIPEAEWLERNHK